MLEFIKIFGIVLAGLFIIRKLWSYICLRISLRIVNSDRVMGVIKKYDPECYEKGMELKRLSEILENLEEET